MHTFNPKREKFELTQKECKKSRKYRIPMTKVVQNQSDSKPIDGGTTSLPTERHLRNVSGNNNVLRKKSASTSALIFNDMATQPMVRGIWDADATSGNLKVNSYTTTVNEKEKPVQMCHQGNVVSPTQMVKDTKKKERGKYKKQKPIETRGHLPPECAEKSKSKTSYCISNSKHIIKLQPKQYEKVNNNNSLYSAKLGHSSLKSKNKHGTDRHVLSSNFQKKPSTSKCVHFVDDAAVFEI